MSIMYRQMGVKRRNYLGTLWLRTVKGRTHYIKRICQWNTIV